MYHRMLIVTFAIFLSFAALAQGAAGCSSTTTTVNGVTLTTHTCGSGINDPALVIPIDAWLTCTETVKAVSTDSVAETVESIDACLFLMPTSEEKATLLIPVAMSSAARVLYAWVANQVRRYAPAATAALLRLVERQTRPLVGEVLKQFARDLTTLLRDHGFNCPNDNNPLTCRRPR